MRRTGPIIALITYVATASVWLHDIWPHVDTWLGKAAWYAPWFIEKGEWYHLITYGFVETSYLSLLMRILLILLSSSFIEGKFRQWNPTWGGVHFALLYIGGIVIYPLAEVALYYMNNGHYVVKQQFLIGGFGAYYALLASLSLIYAGIKMNPFFPIPGFTLPIQKFVWITLFFSMACFIFRYLLYIPHLAHITSIVYGGLFTLYLSRHRT